MKKSLFLAALTLALFSGCAPESNQSTIVGSWTKTAAFGAGCIGADSSFAETRAFNADGTTSDGVTTVPFSQGHAKIVKVGTECDQYPKENIDCKAFSSHTIIFSGKELMVTYRSEQLIIQSAELKECFYQYKKN